MHGPSFLQCGGDEWPEGKCRKALGAYKEVKSEKRGSTVSEKRAKQQYTELLCGNLCGIK